MNMLVLLLIICFFITWMCFPMKQWFSFWFTCSATERFVQVKADTMPTREMSTALVKQDVGGLWITHQPCLWPLASQRLCKGHPGCKKMSLLAEGVNSEYLPLSVSVSSTKTKTQCNTSAKVVSVYPSVTWIFLSTDLQLSFSLVLRK